jgi:hypothetical protein
MQSDNSSQYSFPTKEELRAQLCEYIHQQTQQALDNILDYVKNCKCHGHGTDIDANEPVILNLLDEQSFSTYSQQVRCNITKELLKRGYTVDVGTYEGGEVHCMLATPTYQTCKTVEEFGEYTNAIHALKIWIA